MKIFHSASPGTETEILQQIKMGSIQMGIITDGPFDVFTPEARVISYPFLFDSFQKADKILDGPPGQDLLKRLEKAGFKGFAFSENGFRNLTYKLLDLVVITYWEPMTPWLPRLLYP